MVSPKPQNCQMWQLKKCTTRVVEKEKNTNSVMPLCSRSCFGLLVDVLRVRDDVSPITRRVVGGMLQLCCVQNCKLWDAGMHGDKQAAWRAGIRGV